MTTYSLRSLRNSKTLGFLTLGGLAATSLGFVATPANAASTFAVTNCNDTGAGSLRQAIANQQSAGEGTVLLGKSADMNCTSIETQSEIMISNPLTISGHGAQSPSLRIVASAASHFMNFYDASDSIVGEVKVENIVFDGFDDQGNDTYRSLFFADSAVDFEIINTRFTNISGGSWGLINSYWDRPSNISVVSSTFDNSSFGESLINVGGEATVSNSTFFSNYLYEGAIVSAYGRVDLINNTFVDTTYDVAIAASSATDNLHLTGNLFADTDGLVIGINNATDHGGNLVADGGNDTTLNYGGITNTTPGSGLSAIVPVEDIELGTFANHGGPVPTFSLDEDSIAEDYFTAAQLTGGAIAPTKDARGVSRPQGAGFEPGAYEFGSLSSATKKTATLTLYFNSMSKTVTSKAQGNIAKFVNRLPDNATNVGVTVRGYVQPSSASFNDAKLSLSRAYSTKKALKAAGITNARWNVKGAGKATETGAKARKVIVTVTYAVPTVG